MKYTGFLCGGFSIAEDRPSVCGGWKAEVCSPMEIRDYERYYLPEFVRFNLCPEAVGFGSMERFSLAVDRSFLLDVPVHVPELKLYVMPFRMALFAVRVDIETEDLNGLTLAMSNLRDLGRITSYKDFADAVVTPLDDIYRRLTGKTGKLSGFFHLMENGNKLKIFQIACIDGAAADDDVLLFELGTVAPIGSYDAKSVSSASESYFKRIIEENKLSIFNNWSCLGLTDTVTILGRGCPDWLVSNWVNDYFGLIYIWQLFRKNFIFRLTRSFRFDKKDPEKLMQESVEFEKKCSFHIISYNFLREEFNRCVEHGLKIEEEKQALYYLLEQEKSAREKDSDTKMNYLLFFMTCLTMFSAIYDACCLFNELFPYTDNVGSDILGFRLLASVMIALIFLALLINRLLSKRT